jgi:peptidoglycan pentaglycine glycine transferase (the first glycine)
MPLHLKLELLSYQHRQSWDEIVQAHPHSCFMQSWVWADFKELEGYQTFRYGLFDGSNLIGGCIFYLFPHQSRANLLLAPGGPILPFRAIADGLPLLLQKAEEIAREWGAIALRIEPLIEPLSPQSPNWLKAGFTRAPADLFPSETLVIDLGQTSALMLANMQPKGRYNLRLSWRYEVEMQFSQADAAIPQFYDLFWETVERQKFFGEPYGFFINLCQTLFRADMAEIGLAKWQDETLAAILVLYWGDRAYYLYGGRSDRHPQVMASYAMHWAVMQRAKSRGCKTYDFYGFSSEPQHAYYNFSRFKQKFGGSVVKTIGAHDYFFYDRLADALIDLIQHLAIDILPTPLR